MIKVNVGMSRKVSKDYSSTGFSINLEGEVALSLEDPQLTLERIKEFYDLAEETLSQQIERYSNSTVAERVVSESAPIPLVPISSKTEQPAKVDESKTAGKASSDKATNKQIQFILNLGKRHGLNLEGVEEMVDVEFGEGVGLYQLSKEQAGSLITTFQQKPAPKSSAVTVSQR